MNILRTEGYRAAWQGALVLERPDLRWWRVSGKDPRGMLSGVVSGTMPQPMEEAAEGGEVGVATYHTVLTPKGRMVSDLWLGAERVADGERLWAVVPTAGARELEEHFRRFLPPRLAKAEDRSAEVGIASLAGPMAAEWISRIVFGLRVEAADLEMLSEGGVRAAADDPAVRVVRTREVEPAAYHVVAPRAELAAIVRQLTQAGAQRGDLEDWTVLRVEAGRPAFGPDMDDGVIPTEAGIEGRAIDHDKGCYTGQEVIVRIRDRGHVNRRLRLVKLGEMPPPPLKAELFVEGRTKPAAEVRSSVRSPRAGETLGLAYVRRDVWDGEGEQPSFRTAAGSVDDADPGASVPRDSGVDGD